MKRIWSAPKSSGRRSEILGNLLGVSPIVSEILVQRGYEKPEEAIEFLHPTLLNLNSPFCFCDMRKTIERLTLALKRQEKILIYGDYDVDGVTSTTLLYKVLIDLGFQAVAYIPHRQDEGYGLHAEAVERAAKAGVSVIITVDCGITAVAEVIQAKTSNIDIIITDHHEPGQVLPEAFAIINPKLENSGYPFRDLAGVGVAFKLAQALLQSLGNLEVGIQTEMYLLDLVALGTIADLVPVVGENRIFVHYGLRQMEETNHPGLAALLEECGLKDKPLKAGQIGFMVAPRINAAGRMDSARAGLELLLSEDPERASELARQLTKENQMRQETEKEILAEAVSLLEGKPLPRVIVLSAENWHHGVVGIVASRLVERYYRPVFMISEDGDEAKGSARGILGYPVLEQLSQQAHLLTKFGGHRQAAGFSLLTKDIEKLREGLNTQALAFDEALFQEVLRVDSLVTLNMVSPELLRQLEQMAPFGLGNPGPILACKEIPVHSLGAVGKEQSHIKFRFGSKGEQEGIAFRIGERLQDLQEKQTLDAAFALDWNTFRGREDVQLMIKDVQPEADWTDPFIKDTKADTYQEIAATLEEPEIEWLDWRYMPRSEWPLQKNEGLWVWDNRGSMPTLRLGNDLPNSDNSPKSLIHDKHLDGNEQVIVKQNLGMILGLPLTGEDFKEGVEKFRELGIFRIALAGFESPLEERVRQRCCFISRDELVQLYRELQTKSKTANPFIWGGNQKVSQAQKAALKIFEELGFIQCLGGSDEFFLKWIPAKNKLELDSSSRYRLTKERFDEALKFHKELLNTVLKVL
ncbi:single-stranded-DNA-specific exonuclease RecJ [Desulfosporosinus meridiei DSM 13257]|uniref:Single-stranded-DNA-specific exonuclease RecJ n=1 Tax=Desulfosporosinus meridiei (strain ATCC BAA-275 / DSM 13257 / KCTC 12902 / NCIMB 13706 / S10) TaxID=768704 RepID=J7IV31_DESMD|nr:single-stranded-DNA-specific exonuclease RecJ [Desulfosporosinus meridiei]AFQ42968.1 single-stranded-DNA-specific exonuclease RecJ [Desulfosporosinus meridiei DSM 13257]